MSMFYELMMRKKEQIMYATIKGSLTENDGVFSGFSGTNYLALQNQFTLSPTTKAEFNFKINISSLTNNNAIFGSITNYGLYVGVNSSGNLELFVGDNSSWTTTQTGTTTLSVSTDYDIKLNINNNIATLYINGNIELTANLGLVSSNTYDIGVGRGITTSDYFRGSIDINNSYVKVGVKYNLQAVVGYTIVGSPTIVDGVVSGFSSANYLQINNFPKSVNFSGKIRAKINSDLTGYASLFRFQRISPNDRFSVENNTTTSVRIYHYNENTGTNSNNSIYQLNLGDIWIDYIFNYDRIAKTINLKAINVNDNSIVFDVTYDNCVLDNTDYVQFGYFFNAWQGYIDFNETYIKINNKLWFNGQEG